MGGTRKAYAPEYRNALANHVNADRDHLNRGKRAREKRS